MLGGHLLANRMHIATLAKGKELEKQSEIDDRIDSYTIELNSSDKDYIVDSRLAWHFIPTSFKIYLSCDIRVAAIRISLDDSRSSESQIDNIETLLGKIKE